MKKIQCVYILILAGNLMLRKHLHQGGNENFLVTFIIYINSKMQVQETESSSRTTNLARFFINDPIQHKIFFSSRQKPILNKK